MQDNQMEAIAVLLEETWPRYYFRKNHNNLMYAIKVHLAPYSAQDVVNEIKAYAKHEDSPISINNIVKAVDEKRSVKNYSGAPEGRTYIEDGDGCAYLWNDNTHDYDCIWKWWWADKGITKTAALRAHGLVREGGYR